MRLAEKGFDVIATVEIWAQVQTLKRQAAERGVTFKVEKLDVTNEGDRKKALTWDIEILVNNAGVLEGGSVLDIPAANMRNEFEVNVIGPLLLTQGIAKQMVKRRKGRIVWVSSREGLNVNPFTNRKSTRLNSSHSQISYAVFCLKKKKSDVDLRLHGKKQGELWLDPG